MRPPEHSVPPSEPGPFRHLGAGGPGGERPIRTQLAIALVAGLILVAVPLYLWRRPKSTDADTADAGPEPAFVDSGPPPDPKAALVAAALDGGVSTDEVTLGRVWIDSCHGSGRTRIPAEQCDRQPFFEEALVTAILENTACAPRLRRGGSVSFALKVDFRRKRLHVFAGKSGTLRRKALNTIQCVRRSLPPPDWASLPHQHSQYVIAVLATYPPKVKEPK